MNHKKKNGFKLRTKKKGLRMIQTLYSTASSSSSMPLKSGNEAGTIFSRGGSHFEAGLSDGKDTKNKVNPYAPSA